MCWTHYACCFRNCSIQISLSPLTLPSRDGNLAFIKVCSSQVRFTVETVFFSIAILRKFSSRNKTSIAMNFASNVSQELAKQILTFGLNDQVSFLQNSIHIRMEFCWNIFRQRGIASGRINQDVYKAFKIHLKTAKRKGPH